jgi:hypothetical protein
MEGDSSARDSKTAVFIPQGQEGRSLRTVMLQQPISSPSNSFRDVLTKNASFIQVYSAVSGWDAMWLCGRGCGIGEIEKGGGGEGGGTLAVRELIGLLSISCGMHYDARAVCCSVEHRSTGHRIVDEPTFPP